MQRRRLSLVTIVSSVVAVVIVGVLTIGGGTAAAPGGRATTERDAEGAGVEGAGAEGEGEKGGSSEAEEEGQLTQERLDAWRAAKTAGTVRVKAAPAAPRARLGRRAGDQPDRRRLGAGDRRGPQRPVRLPPVDAVHGPDRLREPVPAPVPLLKVSTDGGVTWGPDRYLCPCRGVKGQFDPEIEVVPNTGAVYAAWMNSNHRGLLQVDRSRPDVVHARVGLGQRELVRQAHPRHLRQRDRRLRRVQRSLRR